jgi:hypothetical protein
MRGLGPRIHRQEDLFLRRDGLQPKSDVPDFGNIKLNAPKSGTPDFGVKTSNDR